MKVGFQASVAGVLIHCRAEVPGSFDVIGSVVSLTSGERLQFLALMCACFSMPLADQVRVFQAHRFSKHGRDTECLWCATGKIGKGLSALLLPCQRLARDWVFVFLERPELLIHVNGPARFYPIELASVSEPRSEHSFVLGVVIVMDQMLSNVVAS